MSVDNTCHLPASALLRRASTEIIPFIPIRTKQYSK
jgi:hypothetical protein